MESVELRAAFIVRVQIQTANTIGFHIKSNTAIFHYILRPVYTCIFCCDFKLSAIFSADVWRHQIANVNTLPVQLHCMRQAANISIVIEIYRNSLHAIFQKL